MMFVRRGIRRSNSRPNAVHSASYDYWKRQSSVNQGFIGKFVFNPISSRIITNERRMNESGTEDSTLFHTVPKHAVDGPQFNS